EPTIAATIRPQRGPSVTESSCPVSVRASWFSMMRRTSSRRCIVRGGYPPARDLAHAPEVSTNFFCRIFFLTESQQPCRRAASQADVEDSRHRHDGAPGVGTTAKSDSLEGRTLSYIAGTGLNTVRAVRQVNTGRLIVINLGWSRECVTYAAITSSARGA